MISLFGKEEFDPPGAADAGSVDSAQVVRVVGIVVALIDSA